MIDLSKVRIDGWMERLDGGVNKIEIEGVVRMRTKYRPKRKDIYHQTQHHEQLHCYTRPSTRGQLHVPHY